MTKFNDKTLLSITRLEKLSDGWKSDNYLLNVEFGSDPQTHANWV